VASPVETPLESPVEMAFESPLRRGPIPGWDGPDDGLFAREFGDLSRDEFPFELDRRLVALCRERGPLRAVLAHIAARLVDHQAWTRLGFARLSDYAAECLGLSARSVRDLAQVGLALRRRPRLEDALVTGTLGWTKVRLLARLVWEEDLGPWIDHAQRVTAQELSKAVRAVDRGSVEAGAAEESQARSRGFAVRCTPEVRRKWHAARSAARRVAGHALHLSEAAEVIAAEVLSALPMDDHPDAGPCEEGEFSWERATAPAADEPEHGVTLPPPWPTGGAGWPRRPSHPRPSYPPALRPLLEGLDEADAFSLDERLQRAVCLERRHEARIGPLLAVAWPRVVHRALEYPTREAYARERLGMDPTRARALVRLERTAFENEAFARGYRSGALSWVKAGIVAPLVSADPLGWFVSDWVRWAERVTARRLRDDVEEALALAETDPGAFRRSGGLPGEAHREIRAPATGGGRDLAGGNLAGRTLMGGDRGIGATAKEQEGTLSDPEPGPGASRSDTKTDEDGRDREIRAPATVGGGHLVGVQRGVEDRLGDYRHPEPLKSAPHETCWARFIGPADIVLLVKTVLCTVRRRMERETGRLPTEGQALGAMLDHCFETWGSFDETLARRYKVFARDGWRCAAPGCSSMRNLHDHHIRFRSAQSSDDLENRITLCAFHHLRGVHGGLLRCIGRAPDGLRWELGIRPRVTPRLAYRSGDIRVALIVA
jgi:hypothetical protein